MPQTWPVSKYIKVCIRHASDMASVQVYKGVISVGVKKPFCHSETLLPWPLLHWLLIKLYYLNSFLSESHFYILHYTQEVTKYLQNVMHVVSILLSVCMVATAFKAACRLVLVFLDVILIFIPHFLFNYINKFNLFM